MSVLMRARFLQLGQSQSAQHTDVISALIVIGSRPEITKYVWAFVIVAGNFEESQKIDAVHDGQMDIGWKGDETRKQSVELVFCFSANAASFDWVKHSAFAIAFA